MKLTERDSYTLTSKIQIHCMSQKSIAWHTSQKWCYWHKGHWYGIRRLWYSWKPMAMTLIKINTSSSNENVHRILTRDMQFISFPIYTKHNIFLFFFLGGWVGEGCNKLVQENKETHIILWMNDNRWSNRGGICSLETPSIWIIILKENKNVSIEHHGHNVLENLYKTMAQ